MIVRKIKTILKKQTYLVTLFSSIAKQQYSPNTFLRWISQLCSIPFYLVLNDYYYRLLMLAKRAKQASHSTIVITYPKSRFLPDPILIAIIHQEATVTAAQYDIFLNQKKFSAEYQFEHSNRLIALGRMDLAQRCLVHLTKRSDTVVPSYLILESLRKITAIAFVAGKSDDYNFYARQSALFRRSLYQPNTPRNYRILGSGWFAALGHLCNLDYFLKYLQLNTPGNNRIVVPAGHHPHIGDAGKMILQKLTHMGIHLLEPSKQALENDYNHWAIEHHYPTWNELSPDEQTAMIDDCWETDFRDGEILPFVHAHVRIQQEWEQAGMQPLFVLNSAEKEQLKQFKMQLGIPDEAWYVCLHVRESGYHKTWDKLYTSVRDSNIQDYTLAIQAITKAGGWVIRMGDPSMTPFIKMERVIDYAHHSLKSPLADILLSAGARFLLSANSGFVNISSMYYVPCVLTNWAPIGTPLALKHDLILPKLCRNKITHHYLTLKDMFASGVAYVLNYPDLPKDIEFLDNTPEEIADVTLEMMEKLNIVNSNNKSSFGAPDAMQQYYDDVAKRHNGFTCSRLANVYYRHHQEKVMETDILV